MLTSEPFDSQKPGQHPAHDSRNQDRGPAIERPSIEPPLPRVRTTGRTAEEQIELSALARQIAERYQMSYVSALIAANRHFESDQPFNWEKLDRWLNPSLERDLPKLGSLKNLSKAVNLLVDAISKQEKVTLVGDYDVDGVCSSTIMYRGLKALGAKVDFDSSRRFSQGYGINKEKVLALHKSGTQVIVMLDFGTKNIEEIALARELGMKVIVIDHHHKPKGKGPNANALINPKQTGCGFNSEDLCTGGLSYVTIRRLTERSMLMKGAEYRNLRARARQFDTKELLPYAAFATVADVVEQRGANRAIIKEGLKIAADSKHQGIRALLKVCEISKPGSEDVGFQIGPRINALGRLLDTGADKGVQLFTTSSKALAGKLAELAQEQNLKRRTIEREGTKRALVLAREEINQLGYIPEVNVIFDAQKDNTLQSELNAEFHQGVVGIMASRVAEFWNRPCIIFAEAENGNLVGSARGLSHLQKKDFHLAETLDSPTVKETLKLRDGSVKAGGHEKAAGLSLLPENINRFKEAVRQEAANRLSGVDITRYETGDVEVTLAELNQAGPRLDDELERFIEPCGEANPSSRFGISKAKVMMVRNSSNGSLKVTLQQIQDGKAHIVHASWFQRRSHPALVEGKMVDLVASIQKHTRRADHNIDKQRLDLMLHAVEESTF